MKPSDVRASLLLKKMKPDASQTHRLIWEFFSDSPVRNRDFIYRFDMHHGTAQFYTVSERPPIDRSGLWAIDSKTYNPQLSVGDRVGFLLRVNPVVTRHDEDGRHKRHDVIMDIKYHARASGQTFEGDLPTIAACKWLDGRSERYGFRPVDSSIRVESVRLISFFRGTGRKPVSLTYMDVSGVLEVVEPQKLKEALFTGIGPAKGYGCGMMMIRRV